MAPESQIETASTGTVQRPFAFRSRIAEHCRRTSTQANDGFTLNSDLSEYGGGGYVVSIASATFDKAEGIDVSDVLGMYLDYAEAFTTYSDELKLGGFSAPEGDDYISVDVNFVTDDESLARELGERCDQKAIWDADAGRPIDTGGDGESPIETVEGVLSLLDATL